MPHTTKVPAAPPEVALAHFTARQQFETDCADVKVTMEDEPDALVLLDVRSGDAFAAAHIDGAISLPHAEITAAALTAFPEDALFVTYCWGPHCNGATKGAAAIAALGRPVKEIDLDAGIGDRDLIDAIRRAAGRARTTTSVCTGAFLLNAAGVLGDVEATTHWEDVALLAERRGSGVTRDDVRWVDAGNVITAGGLSSGIAMALHLVELTADRALAEATAKQIDYVWTEGR